MTQISDKCAVNFKDNSSTKCSFNPSLIEGYLVSLNLRQKLDISLLDEQTIKDKIAARELYLIKGFSGSPENEVSGVQTATTSYGYTLVVDNSTNVNITYAMKYSQCQFRALQSWTGVEVAVFPITKAGEIGGRLSIEDTGTFLKGIVGTFVVPTSLPMKFNNTDVVQGTIKFIADDVRIDHYADAEFELADIDGVITINLEEISSSATEFEVIITAGCNGTFISGLENDIEVLDSLGAPVSVTVTENEASYTIAGTFSGSYSVNFASPVVDVDGDLISQADTSLVVTV